MYNVKIIKGIDNNNLEVLKCIYTEQGEKRYPIHNPLFLKHLNILNDINIILFLKNSRIVGYLPITKTRVHYVLNLNSIYAPIQTTIEENENYQNLFKLALRKLRPLTAINIYNFNFLDRFKELEEKMLSEVKYCIKREFVTHINYTGEIGKNIKRYINKSKEMGCYSDSKFDYDSFREYYNRCLSESRIRKGIKVKYNSSLYYFYDRLIKSNIGRMFFVKDEDGTILSGIFVVYNNYVCVYYHGATSNEGLKKYAGYLNHASVLEFCKQENLIYDLFGVYKNSPDKNYQNLYKFKKKWGIEVEINQYIQYCPIVWYVKNIANKIL